MSYITRALTGLRLSHPEFNNCFVFAVFLDKGSFVEAIQGTPTFYVFCASQNPPLDTGAVLSTLHNVPEGTLTRTLLNGGQIDSNSFQSNIGLDSFDGNYGLRRLQVYPGYVTVGFHSLGPVLRAPRRSIDSSAANLLNMFLQWWLSLLPNSSYLDMQVNVDPGDINNATSLTGRVIRLDSPPAWMIQMAQSGT